MAIEKPASPTSVTQTLASFTSKIEFEDLPPDVIHEAKRLILDTVGCALGGFPTDRGALARKFILSLGGNPQATVLGTGIKTSIVGAAYANGNMANILDNDETLLNFAHPAAPVVIGAFTMAEHAKASGRDLITAVATGYDISARIGLSTESYERRPVGGFGWKTFGAASASAKLLNLQGDQMISAFGLAGMFAHNPSLNHLLSGSGKSYEGYPQRMNKYYDSGWTTQGGVTAAAMAQIGYTGPRAILDGDKGFFRVDGYETVDFPFMVQDLGGKWWIKEASYKRWPLCRHGHHVMTAFVNLVNRHHLKVDEIERVIAKGRSPGFFTQDEPKITPELNIPYCMSMIMFNIPPGPQWYDYLKKLDDPRMKAFRAKITGAPDEETTRILREANEGPTPARPKKTPTTVEISARGQVFSERVEYAKGDPWTPESAMTDQELKDKYRENAADIAKGSNKWMSRIDQAVETMFNLEEVRDVSQLAKLLSP